MARHVINLPAGTELVPLPDIPDLMAWALYPEEAELLNTTIDEHGEARNLDEHEKEKYKTARLQEERKCRDNLFAAIRAGELQIFTASGGSSVDREHKQELIFSTVRLPDFMDYVGRFGIAVQVEAEPGQSKAGKSGNNWNDDKLRVLWERSLLPGVTHAKLADEYGVKRQRIGALLAKAKEKFRVNKTNLATTGYRSIKGSRY